jgi:hypothetical protein
MTQPTKGHEKKANPKSINLGQGIKPTTNKERFQHSRNGGRIQANGGRHD